MFALKALRKFVAILKDYCLNSSLAGFCYIANTKYHYTERLFWLACVMLSSFGCYQLIAEYMTSYESNAISMVVENLHPQESVQFPSVGVCELGYKKQQYPRLEQIMNSLKANENTEYNNDVEDFLLQVIYQNLYNFGALSPYCSIYEDCNDCMRCPLTGYKEMADAVRANCSELFESCYWNDKPFDCCQYFLPLRTTLGVCFLINSLQTKKPGSGNWLDMKVGFRTGSGVMKLIFQNAVAVNVLNQEDVPHILLTALQFTLLHPGHQGTVQLSLQNVINDDEVRDVRHEYRKCIFPDEKTEESTSSPYTYYSFSTCVTQCLKSAQMKICNCTNYNMLADDEKIQSCDYNGLLCLDKNALMFPSTTIMQPWRTDGLVCKCLPSCTEHEMKIVENTLRPKQAGFRSIAVGLQALPTQRYRRQAVRTELDIVVSIGSILGLFMGASILSVVELFYFFTVRVIGTWIQRRNR